MQAIVVGKLRTLLSGGLYNKHNFIVESNY